MMQSCEPLNVEIVYTEKRSVLCTVRVHVLYERTVLYVVHEGTAWVRVHCIEGAEGAVTLGMDY